MDPFATHHAKPLPRSPVPSPVPSPAPSRSPSPGASPRQLPTPPVAATSASNIQNNSGTMETLAPREKGAAPIPVRANSSPSNRPPIARRLSADFPRGGRGGSVRGGRGGRPILPKRLSGGASSQDSDALENPDLPSEYMVAQFDHAQDKPEELELKAGDIVYLHQRSTEEWYLVSLDGTTTGFAAAAFLKPSPIPPKCHEKPPLPPKPTGPPPPPTVPSALERKNSDSQSDQETSTESIGEEISTGSDSERRVDRLSKASLVDSTSKKLDKIKRKSSRFSNMVTMRKRRKSDCTPTFSIVRTDSSPSLGGSPKFPDINRADSGVDLLNMRVSHSSSAGGPPESDGEEPSDSNDSPHSSRVIEQAPITPTRQRQRIAQEILSTEQHYVSVLQTLLTEYQPTLLHGVDHYGGSITKENIQDIFCNLDVITPLNQQLLNDLQKALDGWTEESVLGDIFIKVAPFLKMYNMYSNKYDNALLTLGKCSKNEFFVELMERVDKTTSFSARLEGLLIAPIQRIPRYTLLLQELRKSTDPEHPDYSLLEKAIPLMQEVADYINENIRQVENQNKLMSLSMKGAQGLLKPHRQLLYETVFVEGNTKARKIHCILFNDIIVLVPDSKAKHVSNFEKPKYQWPLHLVWLEVQSSKIKNPNAFGLIGPLADYAFVSEEQALWTRRIQQAIEKHMETLTKTQDAALQKERELHMKWNDSRRYGTYVFPEGQSYSGYWNEGTFEGQGEYSFLGSLYSGEWHGSLRSGQGKMTYLTGDIYEGSWKNDKQEGMGTHKYSNGDSYTGQWRMGRREGTGTLTLHSGGSYEGEWEANQPHGQGEMVYPEGESYKGDWVHGLREGQGTLTTRSGDKYEGEWAADARSGKGTFTGHDGDFYEGGWKDNCYHGKGKQKCSLGTYDGEWVSGSKEGQGVMRYASGIEYKGQWKKNMYHGHGTKTYRKGMVRSYMGDWQYNKKYGQGLLQMFNDDVYDGHFRDNRPHGSGCYTWKNGVSLKSKWVRGSISNGDSVLTVPSKDDHLRKNNISGAFIDGRLVSPSQPPIYLPEIPALDIAEC